MEQYDALKHLVEKKHGGGQLRLRPGIRTEGADDDLVIVLSWPLRELKKARQGAGQRKSIGFVMAPAEFTLPDGTIFQLAIPWVTISAR
jgi:hypothetical protein